MLFADVCMRNATECIQGASFARVRTLAFVPARKGHKHVRPARFEWDA